MSLVLRLLTVYAASFVAAVALPGGASGWMPFQRPVVAVVQIVAAAVVLARALVVRDRERLAWACLGAGALAWAGGDLYWLVVLDDAGSVPVPSPADIGYLSLIPLATAGLLLLARARTGRPLRSQVLDGATAGLAAGSISAALVLQRVIDELGSDSAAVVTNLAYVVGDIVLLSITVATVAVRGWRLDRTWAAVLGGVGCFWVADSHYLVSVGSDAYVWPNLLETGWQVFLVVLAHAAWSPVRRDDAPAAPTGRATALPLVFAGAGLLILVVAALSSLNALAVGLAGASLLAVFGRLALALRDNRRMLEHTINEARTDALTGLGNRRALLESLEPAMAEAAVPSVLALFDLDGFKAYNDTFGHPAGDALLQRLGGKLHDVLPAGARAFRMGGDEFCVLAPARLPAEEIGRLCAMSLVEDGDGFCISASFGAVLLPVEAVDAAGALGLADERLYANKASRRTSASVQTSAVLLTALGARDPELLEHLDGTGDLAQAVARRLGLTAEALEDVRLAAELHDVGKLGIPDAILRKPEPLDDDEWAFMRQHTIIGERILMSAPALRRVAGLVRSSHERWDGQGYPDGLVGEETPIGARIISTCDAYDAMVSDRPYRQAMSVEEACDELRRSAGGQFDPRVVAALLDVLGTPGVAADVDEAWAVSPSSRS